MLSAFSFHEFGFGFKELALVNDKCDGTFYSDTDAVKFEKGGKKMPLHANVSLFSLLEYMAGKDEYWSDEQIVIHTIKGTSLDYPISLQYNLTHAEETMLQYHVRRMGANMDRSPKAHCEITGKGIGYC